MALGVCYTVIPTTASATAVTHVKRKCKLCCSMPHFPALWRPTLCMKMPKRGHKLWTYFSSRHLSTHAQALVDVSLMQLCVFWVSSAWCLPNFCRVAYTGLIPCVFAASLCNFKLHTYTWKSSLQTLCPDAAASASKCSLPSCSPTLPVLIRTAEGMRWWFLFRFRAVHKDGFVKLDKPTNETKMVLFVFLKQADNYGCISEVVKTKLFQLKRSGYENKLHVEAKIKEEGTGMNHLD